VFASLTIAMLALSLIVPLCLGSSQKWKTFESKGWGFRIKYPAEWRIWDNKERMWENEKIFYFVCGPTEEFFETRAIFRVTVCEANGKSYEEIWNEYLAEVKPLMSEVNACYTEKRSNCTLGGMSALEVIWTLKIPDSNQKGKILDTQKGKSISTVKDNMYYDATFSASPMEKYKSWISKADKIFLSFEFTSEKR
jgi:hypothetical protein